MKDRIEEKIKEVEKYLIELEDFTPENFDAYQKDNMKKAACERYFEKIVEACVDLASLTIRYKKLKIPEDDEKAFYVLAHNNIITGDLAKKLKEAKGMRNIIAHEYGEVDDIIVFHSIHEELNKDVQEFIQKIEEVLWNSKQ
ncbi:DUF86 domain-containing protein [Candidatus Pacearchaeota archaeon]|nr:DUF86 domain-containing protein [Candidatus Pacearchaeota archaeon]